MLLSILLLISIEKYSGFRVFFDFTLVCSWITVLNRLCNEIFDSSGGFSSMVDMYFFKDISLEEAVEGFFVGT